MNNSYRILKLRSGEELITRIRGEKKGKLIIERPMVFKSSTLTDTYGRAKEVTTLKNWLSYATQEQAYIPKDFIASFLEPDIDVLKLYNYEKRKDDYFKRQAKKKNKIVKKKKPTSPTNNNGNFDGANDIGNLVNFMNHLNHRKDDEKTFIEKIMEDINNMDDEELEELRKQANEESNNPSVPEDYTNFISMTLFLPPDALMTFVENGLLEEEDVQEVIDGLKGKFNINNNNNPNGWHQKDLFEDLNDREPEEYGNDWRDWSPYLADYFKNNNEKDNDEEF